MGDKRTDHMTASGANLAAWRARLAEVHARNEQVLRGLAAADLDRPIDTYAGERPARWGLQHVIDHNSRHMGHIELTRELWEHLK
ncbi:MAG: DinB family protein [Chloroflexi bacterium]|nr:DinB family protein [Chloroflexota bacterium]